MSPELAPKPQVQVRVRKLRLLCLRMKKLLRGLPWELWAV